MAACISRGPRGTTQQTNNSCVQQQQNLQLQQQQQQYNQIIKIYIEWGNHYLEKARFKKMIQNLQSDFTDGVLLADLVEAVCNQKVVDINRKPRTHVIMLDNIRSCLALLGRLGVSLDGVTAKDVREGNLKVILGLFFALSKFKQQQKQKLSSASSSSSYPTFVASSPITTAATVAVGTVVPPTSFGSTTAASSATNYNCTTTVVGNCNNNRVGVNVISNIHNGLVGSSSSNLRQRRQHLPSQQQHQYHHQQQLSNNHQLHHHQLQQPLLTEDNIMKQSRLPSPYYNQHATNATQNNFPTTGSSGSQRPSRAPLSGVNSIKNSLSANSSRSVSPSHSFIPTPRHTTNSARSSLNEKQLSSIKNGNSFRSSNNSINLSSHTPPPSNKNSMLDKIKVINSRDKSKQGVSSVTSVKRPSSSSGVSSARSERSDSSNSLCNESKHVSPSPNKKEMVGGTEVIIKPLIRRKIIVKPAESKSIKTPIRNGLVNSHKSENRLSTTNITSASSSVHSAANTSHSVVQIASQQKNTSLIVTTNSSNSPITVTSANPVNNSVSIDHLNSATSCKEDPSKTMTDVKGNNSCIPKPTAAVKGTSKPTNSVAPMLITEKVVDKNETIPVIHAEEKQSPLIDKKIEVIEEEIKQEEEEITHQRQASVGEEDDASLMNIKPMEPLLRSYKRSVILPHRITMPSINFCGSRQHLSNGNNNEYMNQTTSKCISRYDLKRVSGDEDHYSSITSGYLSDGDVLQSSACSNKLYTDVDGGYMSEGGAHIYDCAYDFRFRKNEVSNNNILSKPRFNPNISACEKSTDVLTALASNSPLHKQLHNRINGRGHGPDDGPVSPPEPTPTHSKRYCSSAVDASSRTNTPQHSPVVYRVVGSRSHVKKSDNCQQTDNTSFKQVSNDNSSVQWKRYDIDNDSRGTAVGNTGIDQTRVQTRDRQVTNTASNNANNNSLSKKVDKRRTSSTSSSREELVEVDYYGNERKSRSDAKNKVRGVPSSFGYVKRTQTNSNAKESRTAQVSAVPRTKVKVSGGTQTDMKSSSLTNATTQLSQGVRERLMMASTDIAAATKSKSSSSCSRSNPDAGSLSDSTYSDLQMTSAPYNSWFRQGSPYTSSLPARTSAVPGLAEADSIESLPAQLHQHRSSLTYSRLMSGSIASPPSTTSRLSRSNSIRSTKSEKLYPSMFQRSEELEPLYSIPYTGYTMRRISQGEPPSPTNSHLSQGTTTSTNSRYNYMTSPSSTHSYNRTSPYMNYLTKMNSKEDDVRGSAASLISTGSSSLYSTAEDKQAQEVRRLQKDLIEAREKVQTLEGQLSTNAHVVSAFEKSLSNMTQCLEKKDHEMTKLRQTIEMLKKQGANLHVNHNDSANTSPNSATAYSPSLARRHTINSTLDSSQSSNNIARQLSTDSVSSLASLSSTCSLSSSGNHQTDSSFADKHKKKRGWLRSSFSKAFSRSKKNRNGSVSDIEDTRTVHSDMSAPSSPLLNSPHQMNGDTNENSTPHMKNSHSSSALYENPSNAANGNHVDRVKLVDYVQDLEKQLREKDLILTDARLEALSSAHQLQSVKDAMIKMRNEMMNLQQDNERLQKLAASKSLGSSRSSLQTRDSMDRRFSTTDVPTSSVNILDENAGSNGKRISMCVYLGSHGSYNKYVEENCICDISRVLINPTTDWHTLDNLVYRLFKDYLDRIDSDTNLGLGSDSIWSYHIGEVVRYKDSDEPQLLPYDYLEGESSHNITVCLKGGLHNGSLDALVFETLTPKSVIQRYVNLLVEHRRIMLCGPSGTGKSYLANKLAEYLVFRSGKDAVNSDSIVTFNVDDKSVKDLRQYLSNMADQCENNQASSLPVVFILDNLHHAPSLNEIFNGLLNTKLNQICPYIIGIMNQATFSTTNLQLHHNFRWILCANHMEPVKGLLGRYLNRKLIETECKSGYSRNCELIKVVDWVPKVQQHLNKFLETHCSSEVTIGPKLFMSCPMEVDGSQVWFTDLWNYSLVPYLLDAVREGLQLYGKRAPWQDPSQYIIQNYPWNKTSVIHGGIESLVRLRPEDVGYEPQSEADPLLNMLMTLREAANCSSGSRNDDSSTIGTVNIDNLTDNCNNNSVTAKLLSHDSKYRQAPI